MSDTIIRRLKKTNGKWEIVFDDISEYPYAGVWSLYGKKQGQSPWRCLEVAETESLKDEVARDTCMILDYTRIAPYINDKIFKRFRSWSEEFYGKGQIKRGDAKYYHIAKEYDEIKMVLVLRDDVVENRYRAEVEYAMKNKALYWYPAPKNPRCKISQWDEIKKYE